MELRKILLCLLVITSVAIAGCAGSQGTTGMTDTTTTTATTTSTNTGHPVNQTHTDALPLYLENHDNQSHTVRISIRAGANEQYNQSVAIDADGRNRLNTLTGNGSTYRIEAEMGNETFTKNLTLSGNRGNATLVINTSGHLEYFAPSH